MKNVEKNKKKTLKIIIEIVKNAFLLNFVNVKTFLTIPAEKLCDICYSLREM